MIFFKTSIFNFISLHVFLMDLTVCYFLQAQEVWFTRKQDLLSASPFLKKIGRLTLRDSTFYVKDNLKVLKKNVKHIFFATGFLYK